MMFSLAWIETVLGPHAPGIVPQRRIHRVYGAAETVEVGMQIFELRGPRAVDYDLDPLLPQSNQGRLSRT
jgi:hypothetical protein